jgi:DNA modification methylase
MIGVCGKVTAREYQDVSYLGDALTVLRRIPDNAMHLTFTSPPYFNARDYVQYAGYEGYLDCMIEIFKEVHRVTQEGRFLVVNTSPVIVPRTKRSEQSRRLPIPFDLNTRLQGIGWDFIDDIVWRKPDASVKNRNGGFYQHRKPLGYKPNTVTEYLFVYRKHTDRLIDWNMRQYDEEVVAQSIVGDDYERTNVWDIAPVSSKAHPAIFPQELCRRVISYYSYVGDVVLDPFAGIGTTGVVANELGRHYVLIEQEPMYWLNQKVRWMDDRAG